MIWVVLWIFMSDVSIRTSLSMRCKIISQIILSLLLKENAQIQQQSGPKKKKIKNKTAKLLGNFHNVSAFAISHTMFSMTTTNPKLPEFI